MLRKVIVYAVCGVVVAMFSPVLPFRYLAAAIIILLGLALIDLLQHLRRARRAP